MILIIFSEFSKVMVAIGETSSVEIVDLLSTSTQCQNFPNLSRSGYGARGELDYNGNRIVCGGYPSTDKCETFLNGQWVSMEPLNEARSFSSIIKFPFLNDSVSLFSTGSYDPYLNSAEVLVNGKWEKWYVPLPVNIGAHCMVILNSTTVILIGGKQDSVAYSSKTYFLDIRTQTWFKGPELKFGRRAHSCARIPSKSQSSQYSIIAAGGYNDRDMSSVEILDEGLNEWRQGPELPYPICCSAIVKHPLGGVALIGGRANTRTKLVTIYQLPHAGDDAKWELMPQKLKFSRYHPTAFFVPDELADYC